MDKYVVEVKKYGHAKWEEAFSANAKEIDQTEFKIYVRLYFKLNSGVSEYRIIYRTEFVLGDQELPAQGTWRIQTKYNDKISRDQWFFDTPGFATWGDINVMKSSGYSSYDEAFDAIKKFKFQESNPNFVWRIVQD